MKKRIFFRAGALLLAIALLALFLGGLVASNRVIKAKSLGETAARGMCVMDVETGRILFSHNPDTKMGMASTTKIVTALTVLEHTDDIDTKIAIDDKAIGIEGSSIYLQRGEQLTVRELLYGLMLRSGNDAAIALALKCAPTVEEFAELMNQTAKKYGADNSHFTNPHGLDDKNHYTTAGDLAMLTAAALKNPIFAEIVATKEKRIDGVDMPRVLLNKNRLLKTLDGCIGVKTGFTKKSGRCFVGAREADGQKTVCVVLNCGPMFEDTALLLKQAQEQYAYKQLLTADGIFTDVNGGKAVSTEGFRYPLSADELSDVRIEIKSDTADVYFKNGLIHQSKCVAIGAI